MVNAISVDLEDWYHICGIDNSKYTNAWKEYSVKLEENVGKILSLLNEFNITATFFVVGIIARNNPGLIRKIVDQGHEIATHGFLHRRIFDMSPDEFEEDLLASKAAIEEAAGKTVSGYRAPEWSLKKGNVWALEVLKKNGFAYDASAVPLSHLGGRNFKYYPYEKGTRYGNIYEFPLSTVRCFWERIPFSGGLAMRILPYFFILDSIRKINAAGQPVMLYMHPWEFDSRHVKIDLPINRRFMHYFNLASAPRKIRLLLEKFKFSSVHNSIEELKVCSGDSCLMQNFSPDADYVKSVLKFLCVLLSVEFLIIALSALLGKWAFVLILILVTVFYWPWNIFFMAIGLTAVAEKKRYNEQ